MSSPKRAAFFQVFSRLFRRAVNTVGIMKKPRVIAASAALLFTIFALGGLVAWAVADAYFISHQPHFKLVLAASIGLLLLAAYWGIFAAIGYARFSTRNTRAFLIASILIGVPACFFIATFWF
jgi:hypothetical protein